MPKAELWDAKQNVVKIDAMVDAYIWSIDNGKKVDTIDPKTFEKVVAPS